MFCLYRFGPCFFSIPFARTVSPFALNVHPHRRVTSKTFIMSTGKGEYTVFAFAYSNDPEKYGYSAASGSSRAFRNKVAVDDMFNTAVHNFNRIHHRQKHRVSSTDIVIVGTSKQKV